MLSREEFISGLSGTVYTEDESLIDDVLEGIEVDGQPILELFYLSDTYADLQIDYGGGVRGIAVRDVLIESEMDSGKLRQQLGLRSTKQNRTVCEEIIELCSEEIKRGGYLF